MVDGNRCVDQRVFEVGTRCLSVFGRDTGDKLIGDFTTPVRRLERPQAWWNGLSGLSSLLRLELDPFRGYLISTIPTVTSSQDSPFPQSPTRKTSCCMFPTLFILWFTCHYFPQIKRTPPHPFTRAGFQHLRMHDPRALRSKRLLKTNAPPKTSTTLRSSIPLIPSFERYVLAFTSSRLCSQENLGRNWTCSHQSIRPASRRPPLGRATNPQRHRNYSLVPGSRHRGHQQTMPVRRWRKLPENSFSPGRRFVDLFSTTRISCPNGRWTHRRERKQSRVSTAWPASLASKLRPLIRMSDPLDIATIPPTKAAHR